MVVLWGLWGVNPKAILLSGALPQLYGFDLQAKVQGNGGSRIFKACLNKGVYIKNIYSEY